MIQIPKQLLWDYKKAPKDFLWKLQRIADFFPMYGRDRETVTNLYQNIEKLKIDKTTEILIKEYKKAWVKKTEKIRDNPILKLKENRFSVFFNPFPE